MIKATLLVDDAVLAETAVNRGTDLFIGHAQRIELLPDESGQPGTHLVKVVLTQAAYDEIVAAGKLAATLGATPEVQVTEYPIETVPDSFLDA